VWRRQHFLSSLFRSGLSSGPVPGLGSYWRVCEGRGLDFGYFRPSFFPPLTALLMTHSYLASTLDYILLTSFQPRPRQNLLCEAVRQRSKEGRISQKIQIWLNFTFVPRSRKNPIYISLLPLQKCKCYMDKRKPRRNQKNLTRARHWPNALRADVACGSYNLISVIPSGPSLNNSILYETCQSAQASEQSCQLWKGRKRKVPKIEPAALPNWSITAKLRDGAPLSLGRDLKQTLP
jgi:hypothetical protein